MQMTRIATYIIGLMIMTMMVGGKAYAQFEIDPDHFDTPAESTPASKTHYARARNTETPPPRLPRDSPA